MADGGVVDFGNDITGSDSDPDGDALAPVPQEGVAGSNGGFFRIDADGNVTFDPNGAFSDLLRLAYGKVVSNGQVLSASQLENLVFDAPDTFKGKKPVTFRYKVSDGQFTTTAKVKIKIVRFRLAPASPCFVPDRIVPGGISSYSSAGIRPALHKGSSSLRLVTKGFEKCGLTSFSGSLEQSPPPNRGA